MRVLDQSQSDNMAKKKKAKRQGSYQEPDQVADVDNGPSCSHISKGVNPHAIRKANKQQGIYMVCTACSKEASQRTGTEVEAETEEVTEPSIWICLQCAQRGCGRYTKEKHSLIHYRGPRTGCHSVSMQLGTNTVWCYDCDAFVEPSSSSKLQEVVQFIQSHLRPDSGSDMVRGGSSSVTSSASSAVAGACSSTTPSEPAGFEEDTRVRSGRPFGRQPSARASHDPGSGPPGVKGLTNLGNTCYFNSVCQVLSHSPLLEQLLQDVQKTKDGVQQLPGRRRLVSDSSDNSDVDADLRPVQLEPMSIGLGDVGTLTLALKHFLKNFKEDDQKGAHNPGHFFSLLTKKVTRFKGYQQHDSHELLRSLLDAVKSEELFRRRSGILKEMKVHPKNVDDETRHKIKSYGRQADHTFIDSLFGGQLVSIIKCHECAFASHTFEPFLDLSLPIPEGKTPLGFGRTYKAMEDNSSEDEMPLQRLRVGPSKHQQKKAKREAKRATKKLRHSGKHGIRTASITQQEDVQTDEVAPLTDQLSDVRLESESDEAERDDVIEPEVVSEASSSSEEDVRQVDPDTDDDRPVKDSTSDEETEVRTLSRAQISKAVAKFGMNRLCDELPPVTDHCSLTACLNQFTSPELLNGSNKYGCRFCSKKKSGGRPQSAKGKKDVVLTDATKQFLIFTAPAVLTVHLKRFAQMLCGTRKINKHVEFPLLLDLAPYCSALCPSVVKGQQSVLYSLYGLVTHSGTMHSGHYWALVRSRPQQESRRHFLSSTSQMLAADTVANLQHWLRCQREEEESDATGYEDRGELKAASREGHWFRISDTNCTEVRESQVLQTQAYMLFYERIA